MLDVFLLLGYGGGSKHELTHPNPSQEESAPAPFPGEERVDMEDF